MLEDGLRNINAFQQRPMWTFDIQCLKHAFQPVELTLHSVSLQLLPHLSVQERKLRATVFSLQCLPRPWGVELHGELYPQWSGYLIVAVLFSLHSCYNLFSVLWPRSGARCPTHCLHADRKKTGSGAATGVGSSLSLWGGFIETLRHKEYYLLVLVSVCLMVGKN